MFDYKAFIQDCFYLKNKEGLLVPFTFNEVQADYFKTLETDYPSMQGIRENILKGRQFGISTIWSGVFTTDFIMSELGEMPIINSDIYSYKDDDTKAHFERVNMFLDSYLVKTQGGDYGELMNSEYADETRRAIEAMRKQFLRIDTTNFLESKRGAQIMTKTASAKVSGRGSTKQNIHWTECAFYPDTEILSAEQLMVAAEKQVALGVGKIIRESTGNMAGNYFTKEYMAGKKRDAKFKSRFIAWFKHKEYATKAPNNWQAPEYYHFILMNNLATVDQCYWHYVETKELQDKTEMREYPTKEQEAFLYGGNPYFNSDALLAYSNGIIKPIREVEYATAL